MKFGESSAWLLQAALLQRSKDQISEMRRATSFGIGIGLRRRNDVNVTPAGRQMKCKVGKNLAGRGVIGEEEPVDENQSSHRIGQS